MGIDPTLRWWLGWLLSISFAWVSCTPSESEPRNLLLITLDTLRADHLGVYGYERETSPRLDRFAERATVFTDVTCSMPTTLPSHLSIFTGQPPAFHGVRRNGQIPADDLRTVFTALQESGRRTAAVVSASVLDRQFLAPLAFDDFFYDQDNPEEHFISAEGVNKRAFAWLDAHSAAPFALWLHYFDVHEPYAPPPEYAARFKGAYDGPLSDDLSIPWLVSLNDPGVRAGLSERDLQHVVDLYDAEIAYLDAELGRLFDRLEALDLLDNTLIVIVGDHGQAHGENGFFGHGEQLLEPVIQAPLLVRQPGQRQGHRVDAAVETLDLAPTLNELLGLDMPDVFPGRSLTRALRGEPIESATVRLVERRLYPGMPDRRGLTVHRGQRKWTWYRENDGTSSYHLGRRDGAGGLDGQSFYDPASPEAEGFERFLARLDAPIEETPMSAETEEMLRSLGYIQ